MRCTGSPSRAMTTVDREPARPGRRRARTRRRCRGTAGARRRRCRRPAWSPRSRRAGSRCRGGWCCRRSPGCRARTVPPRAARTRRTTSRMALKRLHPRGVELHDVDAVDLAQLRADSVSTRRRVAELRRRPHHQRVRQRVVLERVERLAEARSPCGTRPAPRRPSISVTSSTSRRCAMRFCGLLRLLERRRGLQVDRDVERVAPAAARRRARSAPARAGTRAARARCRSRGWSAAWRTAASTGGRASRPASAA